jgi:hypothetical protein
MRNFIALQNIAHLKMQLSNELNPNRRSIIARLLSEQEARLSAGSRKLVRPAQPRHASHQSGIERVREAHKGESSHSRLRSPKAD